MGKTSNNARERVKRLVNDIFVWAEDWPLTPTIMVVSTIHPEQAGRVDTHTTMVADGLWDNGGDEVVALLKVFSLTSSFLYAALEQSHKNYHRAVEKLLEKAGKGDDKALALLAELQDSYLPMLEQLTKLRQRMAELRDAMVDDISDKTSARA